MKDPFEKAVEDVIGMFRAKAGQAPKPSSADRMVHRANMDFAMRAHAQDFANEAIANYVEVVGKDPSAEFGYIMARMGFLEASLLSVLDPETWRAKMKGGDE